MGRYSKVMIEKMRKACEVFSAALKSFDRTRDDSALRALVLLLAYHASVGRTVGDVAAAATTSHTSVSARYVAATALAFMTQIVAGAVSQELESPAFLWRGIVGHFSSRAALMTEEQLEAKRKENSARYASKEDKRILCKKCNKNIRTKAFKQHDAHCGSGVGQSDARDIKASRPLGTTKDKSACTCAPCSAHPSSRYSAHVFFASFRMQAPRPRARAAPPPRPPRSPPSRRPSPRPRAAPARAPARRASAPPRPRSSARPPRAASEHQLASTILFSQLSGSHQVLKLSPQVHQPAQTSNRCFKRHTSVNRCFKHHQPSVARACCGRRVLRRIDSRNRETTAISSHFAEARRRTAAARRR
jgi:hypothetical protein